MIVFQKVANNKTLLHFHFFVNKFLSFFVSKMSAKESFVEKLQRQSREKLQKLKEEKQKR
jgi:hypothetical protein